MGLMNLLAELHAEPDLKLNLKFEIEVRFQERYSSDLTKIDKEVSFQFL